MISLLCTHEQKDSIVRKFPLMEYFISSRDSTISGLMFEIIICIFGIFTLCHGLSYFFDFPEHLEYYLFSHDSVYMVHLILGLVLIVFYTLVVYTNVKIPKEPAEKNTYIIKGICTGIVFILTIPLFYIYHNYYSTDYSLFIITMLTIIILFVVLSYFITIAVDSKHVTKYNTPDLITYIMIPLDMVH